MANKEKTRFERWFKDNYAYKKMISKRLNAKASFILHDGPPYANGHIHLDRTASRNQTWRKEKKHEQKANPRPLPRSRARVYRHSKG